MLNVMLAPSPLEGRWLDGTVAGHGEIDAYVSSMSVCKNPINTNMPTVDMIQLQERNNLQNAKTNQLSIAILLMVCSVVHKRACLYF
jgi:hypothetical protein